MSNITSESKHVLMPVRVILERRISDNRWIDYLWSAVEVLPGSGDYNSEIKPIIDSDNDISKDKISIFKVETEIDLHRAEAEAYFENLGSTDPSIYVILRPDGPDDDPTTYGMSLDSVSLSPYVIQDVEDIGEDQIEKVLLKGPIAQFLEDFVSKHFKPTKFIKRKRDKIFTDLVEDGKGDPRVRQISDIFRAPKKNNKNNNH